MVHLSACSNLFTRGLQVPSTTYSPGTTTNETPPAFYITKVNQTLTSPTQNLDIIGDGSGSLGTFCAATGSDPNNPTGTTNCQCNYTISSSSSGTITKVENVAYHEANLVRCNYAGNIPFGVTSFQVSVSVGSATQSTSVSNSLSVSLGGSSTLDPTQASSFVKVNRMLCKSLVPIKYLLDDSVVDPIRARDERLTYPLDYYYTNLAESLNYFISSGDATSDCGTNVDQNSVGIFSKSRYAGSLNIDPPPSDLSQFDRSNFYLASQPTGVFAIPVNARIAPSVTTQIIDTIPVANGVPKPLGYAAPHISQRDGTETCPDSSLIPSNYQWVKLWLFKASLSPRNSYSPANLSGIACNPGDWYDKVLTADVLRPVFPVCQLTRYNDPASNTIALGKFDPPFDSQTKVDSQSYLADRVILNGAGNATQCVQLNSRPSGASPSSFKTPNDCAVGSYPGVGCGSGPQDATGALRPNLQGDLWDLVVPNPASYPALSSSPSCLQSSTANDPLNLCGNLVYTTGSTRTAVAPILNGSSVTPTAIDASPRFDYLFVVSPVNDLHKRDFNQGGIISQQFTPMRGLSSSDCSTNGSCPISENTISSYGILSNDINLSDSADPSQNSMAGIYPLCVVQPKSRGN